mmetsp:Transcript_45779/g.108547  ORF Transcript_45779/g.108547 Transcript_45779/m.108547 type:complete len:392 (-) Transcript_45779:33-1208(-)
MGCGSSKSAEQPKPAKPSELRTYTMEEVHKCSTPDESMLIALEGNVYAPFKFMAMHPGGGEILARAAGRDVTIGFDRNPRHSENARNMLKRYHVGVLVGSSPTAMSSKLIHASTEGDGEPIALNGGEDPIECPLLSKKQISPNTFDFTFGLPSSQHVLGLPPGQHVRLIADIKDSNGNIETDVTRSYTPTSPMDQKGTFNLVIKVYHRNTHPNFPDGGQMTQHLDSLQIGDTIKVIGPQGAFKYKGYGEYASDYGDIIGKCSKIGFVCGGSGITPAFQVIQAVLANATEATSMWLVYANQREGDILLREELDKLAAEHPSRFKRWYTITQDIPEGWQYGQGRVTQAMLEEHMPQPAEDTLVTACGPPGMIEDVVVPAFAQLGHAETRVVVF